MSQLIKDMNLKDLKGQYTFVTFKKTIKSLTNDKILNQNDYCQK